MLACRSAWTTQTILSIFRSTRLNSSWGIDRAINSRRLKCSVRLRCIRQFVIEYFISFPSHIDHIGGRWGDKRWSTQPSIVLHHPSQFWADNPSSAVWINVNHWSQYHNRLFALYSKCIRLRMTSARTVLPVFDLEKITRYWLVSETLRLTKSFNLPVISQYYTFKMSNNIIFRKKYVDDDDPP